MGFDKYGSGETFDSCDKFGSGGVLYKPGVSDKPNYPADSPEEAFQMAKDLMIQTFAPVLEVIVPIVENIVETYLPVVSNILEEVIHTTENILKLYPDKRIVWLAIYHKKERVRKKNMRRIMKWAEGFSK